MTNGRPPLIMHVIHHLVTGGMENGLVNLINHLPQDEFRHVVICIEDHSSFAERIRRRDVDVIDLRRSQAGHGRMRRTLMGLCRSLRPQILHTRGLSGLDAQFPALLAGVPARLHGEHGWDVDNLDGRARRPLWLRRLHAPLIHHYVTVSLDLRRYLVERVGIAPHRISSICNGVDTDRFTPGSFPADLGLPADFLRPGVVRIGTVGRLQPVKNQVALLEAAALLRARRPELAERIRLVLVGDGPLREELARHVQAKMLETTTWFAGATERVPEWMRALDVFVLPSLNEGISNTLLEAMATGAPVLASAVGGNPELLEDGVAGHTFAPRDVEGLAALIERYVADPDLRSAHGAAARRRAERDFSLRAMVAAYGDLYRRFALRASARLAG
ncbi:MAG: TIGR03088 family PEP-CTERM/XrtA system glycosyltransferase [Pseudomonadota bacterium]